MPIELADGLLIRLWWCLTHPAPQSDFLDFIQEKIKVRDEFY